MTGSIIPSVFSLLALPLLIKMIRGQEHVIIKKAKPWGVPRISEQVRDLQESDRHHMRTGPTRQATIYMLYPRYVVLHGP